jgi:hypothetical protein
MAVSAGCAGGSGGGGGGRRLSDVVEASEQDGREAQRNSRIRGDGSRTRTRGDESRTRTRTDHQDRSYDEGYDSSSDSGGILGWLFNAIFSGGDDEEDTSTYYVYEEYPQHDPEPVAPNPYVEGEVGGESDEFDEYEVSTEPEASAAWPSLSLGRFTLGYRQGWSKWSDDAIEGFETGMLTAGFGPRDRTKIYLGFYYGHGELGRSDVAAALEDLTEKGIELGVRIYLTPDHTLLGPYILLGGRFGSIDWKYRDRVEVDQGDGTTKRLVDDGVFDGGFLAGAGLSLLQTRRVHLGVSVMAGPRWPANETHEGLVNDIFKDAGFSQWNLEGSFRF